MRQFQNFHDASLFTDPAAESPGELHLGYFDDLPQLSDRALRTEIYPTGDSFSILLKDDAACFDARRWSQCWTCSWW